MTFHISFGNSFARLTRLSTDPLTPWLATVGKSEQKNVESRIETGKLTADGEPWSPWKPRTLGQRTRKGNVLQGLLYDDGNLLANIISKSDTDSVEIGVSKEIFYAPWLHNGTPSMAARPIVGWSDATLVRLELEAAAYLAKI